MPSTTNSDGCFVEKIDLTQFYKDSVPSTFKTGAPSNRQFV
jgi:hypothetical protein